MLPGRSPVCNAAVYGRWPGVAAVAWLMIGQRAGFVCGALHSCDGPLERPDSLHMRKVAVVSHQAECWYIVIPPASACLSRSDASPHHQTQYVQLAESSRCP